jgi:hypothetical protein
MPIITLYHRRFPVKGAPSCVSLLPFPTSQVHTFTVGKDVYAAKFHQSKIEAPENATIDALKNLLCWSDSKGKFKSSAAEVLGFAKAKSSGFRVHGRK